MGIVIGAISFHSYDWRAMATFWSELLGYHDDPNAADYTEPEGMMIIGPTGTTPLVFVQVPDDTMIDNRIHFDMTPTAGGTRDSEVDRALRVGARIVDDRREPSGRGWVVMADPEGNKFCIERSAQEREAGRPAN